MISATKHMTGDPYSSITSSDPTWLASPVFLIAQFGIDDIQTGSDRWVDLPFSHRLHHFIPTVASCIGMVDDRRICVDCSRPEASSYLSGGTSPLLPFKHDMRRQQLNLSLAMIVFVVAENIYFLRLALPFCLFMDFHVWWERLISTPHFHTGSIGSISCQDLSRIPGSWDLDAPFLMQVGYNLLHKV